MCKTYIIKHFLKGFFEPNFINSNSFFSFFFDFLEPSINWLSLSIYELAGYDIIFANNINFYTLIFLLVLNLLFILFLLTQANLLNLSFYPNATFDTEKYSPYECGFAPFWTERAQFDIKFYLVALLFLVFDVELMFLLPYCLSYYYLGFYSYIIFILFFAILIIGFLVEWAVGMLVWKGEDESPSNAFWINEKTTQTKHNAQNYFIFIKNYLRYVDNDSLKKKLFKIGFTNSYYIIWKFQLKRPYNHKYFSTLQTNEFPKNFGTTPEIMLFHNSWGAFFANPTVSLNTVLLTLEHQERQNWIERFFTVVYGDFFLNWFDSLKPEEWNLAI